MSDPLHEVTLGADRVLERHKVFDIFTLRQYALIRSLMAEAYLEGRLGGIQFALDQTKFANVLNADTARAEPKLEEA